MEVFKVVYNGQGNDSFPSVNLFFSPKHAAQAIENVYACGHRHDDAYGVFEVISEEQYPPMINGDWENADTYKAFYATFCPRTLAVKAITQTPQKTGATVREIYLTRTDIMILRKNNCAGYVVHSHLSIHILPTQEPYPVGDCQCGQGGAFQLSDGSCSCGH